MDTKVSLEGFWMSNVCNGYSSDTCLPLQWLPNSYSLSRNETFLPNLMYYCKVKHIQLTR